MLVPTAAEVEVPEVPAPSSPLLLIRGSFSSPVLAVQVLGPSSPLA